MSENDKQAEPVAHAVIAGVLFDFMGWLTSRDERIVLSSRDYSSPAVDAIHQFSEMRGFSLDGARVQDWQTATHSAQPVQPAGAQELRYTADRALAECPCCGSLDVGGVHDTVNCYGCGLTVTASRPLQNAINKWNQRTNKAPAPAVDLTHMVNRFLGWKLPMDFAPDCGISIDTEIAGRNGWPSGTNLLNAEQAKQMFEYVTQVTPAVAVNDDLAKAVHYPGCWDVAAYPTLADALRELATCFQCCECVKNPAAAINEQLLEALKHAQKVLNHNNLALDCVPVNAAIRAAEAEKAKGGV